MVLALPAPGHAAVAQEGGDDPVLWSEVELGEAGDSDDADQGPIEIRCGDLSQGLCASGTSARRTAEGRAEELGGTILEVRDWFEDAGLLPSVLPVEEESGVRDVYYMEGTLCEAYGCVDVSWNNESMNLALGDVMFDEKSGAGRRSTVAHEWFHTGTSESGDRLGSPPSNAIQPLEEAMAEAVGQAFAWPGDLRLATQSRYMSLDRPFFPAPDETDDLGQYGYEKAPYLRYAGRELGAAVDVGYLGEYMDELAIDAYHADGRSDPQTGMMAFLYDGPLGAAPFDEVFPRFVAEINDVGERFWEELEDERWEVGPVEAPEPFDHTTEVEPHAAAAVAIIPITAEIGDRAEGDRLAVAEVRIEDDAGDVAVDDHLHMVFEHEVVPGGVRRWLTVLDRENEGPFVRPVNAAPDPEDAEPRNVRIDGTMEPVTVEPPACVTTGDRAEITISGASLDDVDNFEFRATSGDVEGTTFFAPSAPGDVEIELVVTSPITRPRGASMAPDPRPDRVVNVGTTEVVDDACMVRMHVVGSGGHGTYTYADDYTEYDISSEGQLYAREGEIAIYAEGGWQDFPPGMEQMMLGALGNLPLGAAVPDGHVTPSGMHDLPRRMPEHLGWEAVQAQSKEGDGDAISVETVPCPFAGDECVAVEAPEGRLLYDDARRLVELRVRDGGEEGVVRWEYGTFEIRKPPGW